MMLCGENCHFEACGLNATYPASYVCIGRVEYGSAFFTVAPLNVVKGVYSEMEEGIEGLLLIFIMVYGGLAVFYECDLFYTVYYFAVSKKTVARTVLNIISHGALILALFTTQIAGLLSIGEEVTVFGVLALVYVVARLICLMVSEL